MRPQDLRAVAAAALLAAWATVASPLLLGARGDEAGAASDTLKIESVELEGASRTPEHVLRRYWTLDQGSATDLAGIGRAVAELRASPLFDNVRYSLHPGSERGAVRLQLAVRERGPHLSLGAGYSDLSGWYLIPLELGLDNLGGLGEELRAGVRIGYRTSGAYLRYEEPRFLARDLSWGFRFYGDGIQRVYFLDGVEYSHGITRSGYEVHVARVPDGGWGYRLAYALEGTKADRYAVARQDDAARGLKRGDHLEEEDLPDAIRADVGHELAVRFRAELLRDTRRGRGLRAAGLWGAAGAEASAKGSGSFGRIFGDARLFVPVTPGVQSSLRLQAGAVGDAAPFYDRYYLGGLYTVRGFPNQSLSPPGGDTRFAAASLELRTRLLGSPEAPSLAGLVFADAGETWSRGSPSLDGVSAGAGYGLRLKLPWVGYAGLDAGIPLTKSPVDEAFHLYGTIGWTY
jgi:outer membrane protein insertion porin family